MSSAKPAASRLVHPSEQSQSHGTNEPSLEAGYDGIGLGMHPQHPPSTEPFPNLDSQPAFQYQASLHTLETPAMKAHQAPASPRIQTPLIGLRVQTDHLADKNRQDIAAFSNRSIAETPQPTIFNAGLPVRHSSIRSSHSARTRRTDSLSPRSAASSPGVGSLVDMTPLPSPISLLGSPATWRKSIDEEDEDTTPSERTSVESATVPMETGRRSPEKRKAPFFSKAASSQEAHIYSANAAAHATNRSLSDYVSNAVQAPKPRNITVSASGAPAVRQQLSPPDDLMRREECLAIQRGLSIAKPPTPPDSNRGSKSDELERPLSDHRQLEGSFPMHYEAKTLHGGRLKKWRAIKLLGEGQFSRVVLAASEETDGKAGQDSFDAEISKKRDSLVAIKICNHGPAGGADERKVEVSIRREVEILKVIHHPSLVHLIAVSESDRRTLLVLNYCAGGDLFELASSKLELLTSQLVRRVFAELVAAVRHLHLQYIVHRDIKLENILVNVQHEEITRTKNWETYPSPVITLTDLGLGKWIPKPPESPLLSRRCGSEDYAAPEVLIGQEYDGRSTDAWALGVVLYSLMEGRMPFDPVPGSKRRSPTSHKIARCEWQWVKWANADGEWDEGRGKEFEGAQQIVEGLLARARNRWTLEKVQQTAWVSDGIQLDGGLKYRREE
ncbi:MAG: hypothetical protein Q9163_005875 [Psora crenata]